MAQQPYQNDSGEPIGSDRSSLSNAFSESLRDCMIGPENPICRTASPGLQPTPASRQATLPQSSFMSNNTRDSPSYVGNLQQGTYPASATHQPLEWQAETVDPRRERQQPPSWLQRRRDSTPQGDGVSANRQQLDAYPPSFLRPTSRSAQHDNWQQQQQQQDAVEETMLQRGDPADDVYGHQAALPHREDELDASPQPEPSLQQPQQQQLPQPQCQPARQTSGSVVDDTAERTEMERDQALQYLAGCPAAFRACADVVLLLEGRRLMVHSQILASQSTFFANMWTDLGLYNCGEEGTVSPRQGPLELEAAFKGRALADVVLWLDALYKNLGPTSVDDARRLAQMADEFECRDMARRCDSFLAGHMAIAAIRIQCSQGPESQFIEWALLAERCRLWGFLSKWEALLIDDWQVVRRAENISHLSSTAALRLANGMYYKSRHSHRPSAQLLAKWQRTGDLSQDD